MFGGWMNALRKRLTGMERLLEPKSGVCAFCRSHARDTDPMLSLCRSCLESIPWIREIHCETCGRGEPCPDCGRRKDTAFRRNRAAVRYDDAMKSWLARYKYRGDERLSALMGGMLMSGYRRHLEDEPALARSGFDWISYVPVNETRLQERGFNQAEQMARHVALQARVPVGPLLVRLRHTGKQSFKTRAERLDDMAGAFAVDPDGLARLRARHPSGPVRILLVDDVYTTGSTLQHCARALRAEADVEVYGLTWAR